MFEVEADRQLYRRNYMDVQKIRYCFYDVEVEFQF